MENNKIKIIFIGTPRFGGVVLEKLSQVNMKPILVITSPDKPVGRKKLMTPPFVKITAQNHVIPIIQPEKIRNCKSEIDNLRPDLVVVASYGQILPQEILEVPKYGSLNVHPSLLPKYRGATPIQSAILNGEKETGATIILMDARIDAGPILSQRKTTIGPNETGSQLHDRLAVLGAELLIDTIPDWLEGKIKLRYQKEDEATYTKILARDDGQINWREKPEQIYRKILAFDLWPGTFTVYKERKIKILKARLEKDKLIIEKVHLEGKKPTDFQDFLRGHKDYAN